jgi:hypothetical protein
VKPTLQLLSGTAGTSDPAPESSFRLRPGERAVWIEVSAADGEMRAWRREASSLGLSVDVLVALKLEWSLVRADIADPLRLAALVECARTEAAAPRLAPSDELRRWLAFLGRGAHAHAEHDLPSVALPARVVARVTPALLSAKARDETNRPLEGDGLVVERAASLNGMTLESWAYRTLASLQ